MEEITLSTRIPYTLLTQLEQYMEAEHLDQSTALRKLLFKSLQEWKEDYALKLLEEGKTTLSKAAQLAGLDLWSLTAKIKERKIQWVKDRVVREELNMI